MFNEVHFKLYFPFRVDPFSREAWSTGVTKIECNLKMVEKNQSVKYMDIPVVRFISCPSSEDQDQL